MWKLLFELFETASVDLFAFTDTFALLWDGYFVFVLFDINDMKTFLPIEQNDLTDRNFSYLEH